MCKQLDLKRESFDKELQMQALSTNQALLIFNYIYITKFVHNVVDMTSVFNPHV